jgi:hypothetical protein
LEKGNERRSLAVFSLVRRVRVGPADEKPLLLIAADKLEACRPSQVGSLTSSLTCDRGKREFIDAAGLIELNARDFEAGAGMGLRAARG